jgi:hypothetical protein
MQPLKLPHLLHGAKYLLLYIYYCQTYMGATAELSMERVSINNIGCF